MPLNAVTTPDGKRQTQRPGWADIQPQKQLDGSLQPQVPDGSIIQRPIVDDTQPPSPPTLLPQAGEGSGRERSIEYHAPFFKPDREADYRSAWAFFENRGGA